MFARIVRFLLVAGVAVILVVFAWPQAVGLQGTWVVAHAVSLRGLAVVGAGALVAVLLALSSIRPFRRVMIGFIVVTVFFGAVNAAVIVSRGVGTDASAQAESSVDSVTVLSWNTLGDAPGAAAIAALALEQNADVVTLPETTQKAGVAVAEAMRAGGRPMWVHTLAFDQVSKARSTTLLISPDLGDYSVSNSAGSGPPGNTNVLPTVVATPSDGVGPTIVAVHAVAPIRNEMMNWRSDLDWLADQCSVDNVIMAGDFNATIDHMSARSTTDGAVLGDCRDAALASESAGLGTWPTRLPALLGSPIDHVLASANWTVTDMRVLESLDAAGSDHRPILATLTTDP